MQRVVFLRAVNVGGANRCRPAEIAKKLAKFGVVNIGAVGTFVVRKDVSESVLRAAMTRTLSFKCEIMICPAKAIVDLAREVIAQAPLAQIDYVDLVDGESLQPIEVVRPNSLLALAVFFGKTRLIDNTLLG